MYKKIMTVMLLMSLLVTMFIVPPNQQRVEAATTVQTKVRPILFVHGRTGGTDTFASFKEKYEQEFGSKGEIQINKNGTITTLVPVQVIDSITDGPGGRRVAQMPIVISIVFEDNIGTIAKQAEWLKIAITAIKKQLNVPQVDIWAHSMGGLAATKYILDNGGADINTLITFDSPILGSDNAFYLNEIKNPIRPLYTNDPTLVDLVPGSKALTSLKDAGFMTKGNKFNKNIKVISWEATELDVVYKATIEYPAGIKVNINPLAGPVTVGLVTKSKTQTIKAEIVSRDSACGLSLFTTNIHCYPIDTDHSGMLRILPTLKDYYVEQYPELDYYQTVQVQINGKGYGIGPVINGSVYLPFIAVDALKARGTTSVTIDGKQFYKWDELSVKLNYQKLNDQTYNFTVQPAPVQKKEIDSYRTLNVQINGVSYGVGVVVNNDTYIPQAALNALKATGGTKISVDGAYYYKWNDLSVKVTAIALDGGYNFVPIATSTPTVTYSSVTVKLNGVAYEDGIRVGSDTYLPQTALNAIYATNPTYVDYKGKRYYKWTDFSVPLIAEPITGGYNFKTYYQVVRTQVNGKDFLPGYMVNGSTYLHSSVLTLLGVKYTGKETIVVKGVTYIKWTELPLSYSYITGGYNFTKK
ncbi:hypothetical protein PCCS19_05750 [Paenibacillus sp. CCS19]|uniref:alpha/beta hydrolase n=1 Tax=Paenibacillus sp. CCS19 TaxID=3158387 RepID=UPI0025686532|nr:alpha/beta hydrolase [Paenibacillus cellulosilyticus]GMK37521.1 hypothetical protein PCCS19_05750 [Paenibacillus cellulosilyticus]